jgi:hypothetical protein
VFSFELEQEGGRTVREPPVHGARGVLGKREGNPGVAGVASINGHWTLVIPLVAALFIRLSWLLLICGLDVEGVVSYGVLAG